MSDYILRLQKEYKLCRHGYSLAFYVDISAAGCYYIYKI